MVSLNNVTWLYFHLCIYYYYFLFDFVHSQCTVRLLFHSLFTFSSYANKTVWLNIFFKKTFRDIFRQLYTKEYKATKKQKVKFRLKLNVQGQRGGRILEVAEQGGRVSWKLGNFHGRYMLNFWQNIHILNCWNHAQFLNK